MRQSETKKGRAELEVEKVDGGGTSDADAVELEKIEILLSSQMRMRKDLGTLGKILYGFE